MKKLYLREIEHVVHNYLLRGKASPYLLHHHTALYLIVLTLIKLKLFECTAINHYCMYVIPTKQLLQTYGKEMVAANVPPLLVSCDACEQIIFC